MSDKLIDAAWATIVAALFAVLALCVGSFISDTTNEKEDIQALVSDYYNTSDHNKEIDCLAENAYHEARGEGAKGQIAVSEVVMNRVQEDDLTACEIIHERKGDSCQFSWVCANVKIDDQESYDIIRDRVRKFYINRMLREEFSDEEIPLVDATKGATFYHAKSVRPYWVTYFQRTAKIGNHWFYREEA